MLAGHLGSLNVRGLFWKPFNYHHTQALVSSSRDSHPDGLRRQVTGKRSVEVEEVGCGQSEEEGSETAGGVACPARLQGDHMALKVWKYISHFHAHRGAFRLFLLRGR